VLGFGLLTGPGIQLPPLTRDGEHSQLVWDGSLSLGKGNVSSIGLASCVRVVFLAGAVDTLC
jgi:hypothetical protein